MVVPNLAEPELSRRVFFDAETRRRRDFAEERIGE
jgi:hypothetical protein